MYEALQAYAESDPLYGAHLIHMYSKAVIKIVRYSINFTFFPGEHTLELCERQLVKHKQTQERNTEDFEPEITFIDEENDRLG